MSPHDEPRCDRCGKPAPLELGDRRICEECYSVCGSCCLEFGADDLWAREEEEQERLGTWADGGVEHEAMPRGLL